MSTRGDQGGGGSRSVVGGSTGSTGGSRSLGCRSGSRAAGSRVDSRSRRSESVEITAVVQVERLEVLVDTVGGGESDRVGGSEVSVRQEVRLEADGVDLGVIGVVHGDDLMSDEVRAGTVSSQMG
jgi:microcompartment protein CcmK/EutM